MRVVEVISAMVEKELEQRNFGFDSLKSRLNRDMEEEGIVARRQYIGSGLHRHPGGQAAVEPVTWRRLPRHEAAKA